MLPTGYQCKPSLGARLGGVQGSRAQAFSALMLAQRRGGHGRRQRAARAGTGLTQSPRGLCAHCLPNPAQLAD